jgi:ribosomal protein S18 acetylase RimI-like enzyme
MNHVCACLSVLTTLLVTSLAVAQGEVKVREYAPSDEHDWQLARRLSGLASLPTDHGRWSPLWLDSSPQGKGSGAELVAEVDGLVVGRVHLEAHHHPYCELVNLSVRPDYEGLGVATTLVREAIARARALGLKVMVLQEFLDEAQAHGIYQKAGFLPATRGEMLRLVKLLDVPLVSGLLKRAPQAEFTSKPAPERGEKWWRLSWNGGPQDFVALYLHGGSCQFDSDGFQPVFQAGEFTRDNVSLALEAEMTPELARGEVGDLRVTVKNLAKEPFRGVVRAVLLPDTQVEGDLSRRAPTVALGPGEQEEVLLPVKVTHDFRCDFLRFGSYPSMPMTAEVCWERGSVLLSVAVKVS